MFDTEITLAVQENPAMGRIDCWIVERRSGRMAPVAIAGPVQMTEVDEGTSYPEPAFRMAPEAASQLMDRLWAMGIRPHDVADPSGEIRAMKEHLSDLRKLVEGLG